MTGSGAGFLLVPGLSLALSFGTFPSPDLFKIAVATTHGANLITNLAAFQAHAVRRSIDWAAFIRLSPGSIAGAAAGALLVTHLDTAILELVFMAFAVALSARLLRPSKLTQTSWARGNAHDEAPSHRRPNHLMGREILLEKKWQDTACACDRETTSRPVGAVFAS